MTGSGRGVSGRTQRERVASTESRWADYVPRPPTCDVCGERVTLKQSSRMAWDENLKRGFVVHSRCEGFKVRVMVEAAEPPVCAA